MSNKILRAFEKQPAESLYFKVHFTDWLADQGDEIVSVVAEADPGITLSNQTVFNGTVKILYSGGTDGEVYKVTLRATCTSGQIKEAEIEISVVEV